MYSDSVSYFKVPAKNKTVLHAMWESDFEAYKSSDGMVTFEDFLQCSLPIFSGMVCKHPSIHIPLLLRHFENPARNSSIRTNVGADNNHPGGEA